MRKIQGRPPRTVHILRENGRTFSKLQDICNKLANTQSNGNYSEEFKKIKRKAEKTRIHFDSSNEEEYNKDFSFRELETVLCKLKDRAPGPD